MFGESRCIAERVSDVVATCVAAVVIWAVVDNVARFIVESTAVKVILDRLKREEEEEEIEKREREGKRKCIQKRSKLTEKEKEKK